MSNQPLHIDDIWMSLAKSYSDVFMSMKTEEYFKMISGTKVVVECWGTHIYSVLVKRKHMVKFDELPKETRDTLWNDALHYFPNAEEPQLKKLVKAIHAISTYIQI